MAPDTRESLRGAGGDAPRALSGPSAAPAASGTPGPPLAAPDPRGPGAQLRVELARKAIHLASSVVPLSYAAGLPRRSLLGLLAVLGVVAVAVELARFRSPRVRSLFLRLGGALLREHEHRGWSGATWLVLAYALAAALFPRDVAVTAMLAAGFGDASAAIVGRTAAAVRAWRGRPPRPGKTLVGSAACAVVTCAAALLVARLAPAPAVAAALLACAAERWPVSARVPIDDNVRVALGAGIGALLLT